MNVVRAAQGKKRKAKAPRHSRATRFAHGAFAIGIIVQLLTSVVSQRPGPWGPGNTWFHFHEYAGLVTFTLAFLFWLAVMTRAKGTALGALFPWFTAKRRRAVAADFKAHLREARHFALPKANPKAAFPSAIHGLGLALMTAMAVTGALYFLLSAVGPGAQPTAGFILGLHSLMGNLVWAYLIGHALLAILHHVSGSHPLTEMWSPRG